MEEQDAEESNGTPASEPFVENVESGDSSCDSYDNEITEADLYGEDIPEEETYERCESTRSSVDDANESLLARWIVRNVGVEENAEVDPMENADEPMEENNNDPNNNAPSLEMNAEQEEPRSPSRGNWRWTEGWDAGSRENGASASGSRDNEPSASHSRENTGCARTNADPGRRRDAFGRETEGFARAESSRSEYEAFSASWFNDLSDSLLSASSQPGCSRDPFFPILPELQRKSTQGLDPMDNFHTDLIDHVPQITSKCDSKPRRTCSSSKRGPEEDICTLRVKKSSPDADPSLEEHMDFPVSDCETAEESGTSDMIADGELGFQNRWQASCEPHRSNFSGCGRETTQNAGGGGEGVMKMVDDVSVRQRNGQWYLESARSARMDPSQFGGSSISTEEPSGIFVGEGSRERAESSHGFPSEGIISRFYAERLASDASNELKEPSDEQYSRDNASEAMDRTT